MGAQFVRASHSQWNWSKVWKNWRWCKTSNDRAAPSAVASSSSPHSIDTKRSARSSPPKKPSKNLPHIELPNPCELHPGQRTKGLLLQSPQNRSCLASKAPKRWLETSMSVLGVNERSTRVPQRNTCHSVSTPKESCPTKFCWRRIVTS